MSRQSNAPESWLAAPLGALTRLVVRRPRVVVAVSLIAALACVLIAAKWLGFRTNRLDLLSPKSSFNQRWLAYLDEFGDEDDVVVVVEGPNQATVTAAVSDLGKRLTEETMLFDAVLFKNDLTSLRSKALHFLTIDELRQVHDALSYFQPLLEGDWTQLSVHRMLEEAHHQLAASAHLQREIAESSSEGGFEATQASFALQDPRMGIGPQVAKLADALNVALKETSRYESPWPESLKKLESVGDSFNSTFLLANDGKMGFVILRFAGRQTNFAGHARSLARLRELREEVAETHQHVSIGITGMPVLETDEMESSQSDTIWTSVISLVGVSCVFVAGFGGVRRPLMTVAALLLALAWSFGFIVISVGHLNILSASFGVILIGLGIDFGIHYMAQYNQLSRTVPDRSSALIQSARRVGPGIVTGGATTALAFSTTALTHFTGVVELGTIAAGGIVLCVIAAVTVLPALIMLFDRPQAENGPAVPIAAASYCEPFSSRPQIVIPIAIALTGLLASGLTQLRYDHNLLNLQPANQESVNLERKLAATEERGVWYALSFCESRDELIARREQLEALEVVTATEEIVSLVPETSKEKQQIISSLSQLLEDLPREPPLIPIATRDELRTSVELCSAAFPEGNGNDGLISTLNEEVAAATYFDRLSHFQQNMACDLLQILNSIRVSAAADSPHWEDLPAPLVRRFVGQRGRHLLRIYGDSDLWNMEKLKQFVTSIEQIDPNVTGHPVQTYYASRQMLKSYLHAAVYSLIAVSIMLMIDFRKIRWWLLATIPMTLGMLQLFGLLGWLGIPLNPANMIVLPLILGIGIDDGVHVVHDFLDQKRGYRLSNATANAVLLTSATTMIGFGTMMFASHQGLRSLGQVLTIGIFCCLTSSLLILPPILHWLNGGFSASLPGDKLEDSATTTDST